MNSATNGWEVGIGEGQAIGPYVVVRKLGAGGMGEVYLARHRLLDRNAAVKVLLPQISLNEEMISRFFTEARATAKLRHPNIVEIFDCDVLPDRRAYIVMEFLAGESLRSTLDRVPSLASDFRSIAAIAGMVADGLFAAHGNGIVHRDLKPDNIFLTVSPSHLDQLTVKILDFGIAKLLSDESPGMGPTRTGSLIGTPLYMSPEQCRGLGTINHSSDIYSLGCVLFEMLVGSPPFTSTGPGDILMGHMVDVPPLASALQPEVPAELDALVNCMLAKEPGERPQSMAHVVAAIEGFLGMRCSEFGTAISWPQGFPGSPAIRPAKVTTPADVGSGRWTPPPPKGANRTPYTGSPSAHTHGPTEMLTPEPRLDDMATTALVHPWRTWMVAGAAAVALVLLAGVVYLLARPSSPARKTPERPALIVPSEPSVPAVKPAEPVRPAPSPAAIPVAPKPLDIDRGSPREAPAVLPPAARRPPVAKPIERLKPKSKKQPAGVDDGASKYERVGD